MGSTRGVGECAAGPDLTLQRDSGVHVVTGDEGAVCTVFAFNFSTEHRRFRVQSLPYIYS